MFRIVLISACLLFALLVSSVNAAHVRVVNRVRAMRVARVPLIHRIKIVEKSICVGCCQGVCDGECGNACCSCSSK